MFLIKSNVNGIILWDIKERRPEAERIYELWCKEAEDDCEDLPYVEGNYVGLYEIDDEYIYEMFNENSSKIKSFTIAVTTLDREVGWIEEY